MPLDTNTLLFILVATSGLMAAMFFIAFWASRVPEATLWAGMLITQMFTWALYWGRGVWPDQGWIIVFGNSIMTLGWAFATHSLAVFHRIKGAWLLHYTPVPVIALGTGLLLDNLAARLLLGVLVYVGQMSVGIVILLSKRGNFPSVIRNFIAASVILAAVAILIRAVYGWVNPGVQALTPENDPMHTYVLLTAFVTMIATSCGFLLLLRDRTEQQVRHLATHDTLTGAWNRGAFINLAEREMTRCQRNGRPLAMLMLDLDFFKKINDAHGHLAGDQVLIQLAKTLQACLRPQDLFGRYGGEEFCVLLPETNAEGARNIGERLRAAAEALEIVFGESKLRATVSIGVAELSAGASDLADQLFVEADRELYIAKSEGRNRVSG